MEAANVFQTQEERLMVDAKAQVLRIGIPLESTWAENRVSLTPEGVHLLVAQGHEVVLESTAGLAARYSDREYSEAGAEVTTDRRVVFGCPVLAKVEAPSELEWPLMAQGQVLFSTIQPGTLSKSFLDALKAKRITAFNYGSILDEEGRAPFVRSMAEIGGSQAITIAMEYLSTWSGGKGYAMGAVTGVPPTEVVILGAGTVGTTSARLAIALGASVKVFDSSLTRLQRLREQVGDLYTCTLQPQILARALSRCDVVIGALRPVNGRTPVVVTSWDAPVYTKFDVTHFAVPNIASRVARTASFALNNLTSPMLRDLADLGGVEEALRLKPHWRSGVYLYHGQLTSSALAQTLDQPFTELDLLL
jgi:alanine dehydrogenase